MASLTIGLMEPVRRWNSHYYPVGIMYISAYLEKHGYKNYLINNLLVGSNFCDLDQMEILVLNKIAELKLDLLGITCALNEVNCVLSFCRRIKKELPRLKIMVGGPMPTTCPEFFLQNEDVDFVVRGEGEKTVLNLVKALESILDFSKISGISRRNKNSIVHNPPQPLIENLDDLPRPAYEKINMTQYTALHEWVIRGFPLRGVFAMSSRGCPFHCTFCGASLIHGRKVRYRSPESIYDEVKFLKERYKVEGIFFCDDTLLVSKNHVMGICRVMKELDMFWGCFSRVDTLTAELAGIMKKSGCIQLDFGVESGSDRILSEMKKGTTVVQAKKAFALCRKYKLRTFANVMIGLPTETESEMYETFHLAKQLNANAYILSIAMPIPGSELWNVVNPRLTIDEYDKLSWDGKNFEMTDRCNMSRVPTERLISLYHYFDKVLQLRAVWKTLTSYHEHLAYIIKLDHKFSRLWCELLYLLKQFKIVRRIGRYFKKIIKKIRRT